MKMFDGFITLMFPSVDSATLQVVLEKKRKKAQSDDDEHVNQYKRKTCFLVLSKHILPSSSPRQAWIS